ncbi:hypothetical protein K431DRAFT_5064 [Polychaeton citri CBS 116435]|uniref:Plus3 domain-containing protein n=1 Tax=Polychaeton citri CBS 116435 TaxID=1314669 RepID=A0A9P4QJW2_9PEZI|nr:hypothetical protein K431DRAFT_5064 [Polychaeton citri CBS 116435]
MLSSSEAESERSPRLAGQMSDSEHDALASPLDDEDDDAPLYPVEGKFVSEQERDDILSRPEIEREQILAEREEAVQKRLQDLQLKQLLSRARKDGEKAQKKRTAAAAELGDEDGARSRRPKAEGKGRSALDAYKQAREAKGADRTSRLEAPGRGSRRDERSPSSVGSDRDADAESEVEWAEPSSERRDRDEPPPALRDFELCRVGRSNFARVCFWPGFEDTIKGCFARVFLEQSRTTGQNVYRMAQIKGESLH